VQNPFFTFPDRSLKYDCPSCGSQCCKGKGLALEARAEVVRFARLEPRLAALLYPMNERFAQVMDVSDGCWMLRPDGLCAIETDRSYAEKPHTCRLFPFNRIFTVGDARVVDFNSKICPLQDVADARSGQSWADLEKQIAGEGGSFFGRGEAPAPPGGAELSWLSHEGFIRDAIDAHLGEPDYAEFAGLQEQAVLALMRKQPLPSAHSEQVQARAQMHRKLLQRFRAHHGVEDDPGLAQASRLAARQAALLTCSWRLSVLLRKDAAPYGSEIQLLPKRLLATSHLLELSHLARRQVPGLRAATETFQGAAPLIGLLSLFPRRVRLKEPLQIPVAVEVEPALRALSQKLLQGEGTLADGVAAALPRFAPPLRSMALSALAFGDAELLVE
jgi:Fe-S-cluster containining protein